MGHRTWLLGRRWQCAVLVVLVFATFFVGWSVGRQSPAEPAWTRHPIYFPVSLRDEGNYVAVVLTVFHPYSSRMRWSLLTPKGKPTLLALSGLASYSDDLLPAEREGCAFDPGLQGLCWSAEQIPGSESQVLVAIPYIFLDLLKQRRVDDVHVGFQFGLGTPVYQSLSVDKLLDQRGAPTEEESGTADLVT